MRSPRLMIRPAITVTLAMIGATIPTRTGGAAVQVQAAGDQCCPYTIVSIDARAGVVTAQETASGKTFTFEVNDAELLSSLTAGEAFDTDPALSALRRGASFSLVLAAAARPVARPTRGIVRPTVTRFEECCLLAPQNAFAGAAAAAEPAPPSDAVAASARGIADREIPAVSRTRALDPCEMATEALLRLAIDAALDVIFPIEHRPSGGEFVTFSNPDLRTVECPGLRIEWRNDVRYRKTRGFPQYQVSGVVRYGARLEGEIRYTAFVGERLRPEHVEYARVCFTDLEVLAVDLSNVPNWLDNTYIRDRANEKVQANPCWDVTQYVVLYLQNGGVLIG